MLLGKNWSVNGRVKMNRRAKPHHPVPRQIHTTGVRETGPLLAVDALLSPPPLLSEDYESRFFCNHYATPQRLDRDICSVQGSMVIASLQRETPTNPCPIPRSEHVHGAGIRASGPV